MTAVAHTERELSARKKWLFRAGLILAPFILWVVIECLLSLFIGKEKPFRRFQTDRGEIYALNQAYFDQYFLYRLPRMRNLPVTNNRMPILKGNERRIFCLGGSTTVGYPYNGILEYECPVSFPRFAETILNDSGLEVRVLNLGCNAFGSREVKRVLADALVFAPDLFLIYSGHNEFFGPNEFAISKSKQLLLSHQSVADIYDMLRRTWLYRGLSGLLRGMFSIGKWQEMDFSGWAETNFIPPDQTLEARLQQNYRKNLTAMIWSAQQAHVPVLLCTVVSNWVFPPFMSVHKNVWPDQEKAEWERLFQEGKNDMAQGEWGKALQLFAEAERLDSVFADLHFQKAKAYRALGQSDRAATAFRKALDLDALPFRARTWVNPIIREIGRSLNVPVLDLEAQFIHHANEGLPDPNLFLEHLHPNVNGYYQMGRGIAESLLSTQLLGASKPAVVEPLENYLERYDISQLAIDKVEYDMSRQGNYLERLSLFNPEVREFVFNVSKRAYDDAVKIRDAYLNQEDK